MSQSSFVLKRDLQFTDAGFHAKAGDVLVYTPPQALVVYRNGDIQIRMATSQAALDGLMIAGSLARIQEVNPEPLNTPAPVLPTPEVVEESPKDKEGVVEDSPKDKEGVVEDSPKEEMVEDLPDPETPVETKSLKIEDAPKAKPATKSKNKK